MLPRFFGRLPSIGRSDQRIAPYGRKPAVLRRRGGFSRLAGIPPALTQGISLHRRDASACAEKRPLRCAFGLLVGTALCRPHGASGFAFRQTSPAATGRLRAVPTCLSEGYRSSAGRIRLRFKSVPCGAPSHAPFCQKGVPKRSEAGDLRSSQPRPPASEHNKKPVLADRFCVLALSIFPGSRPPSIVDGTELNFCVRDGNRWTLRPINTNFVAASFISFASVATASPLRRKLTHSAAAPLKITNTSPVCDFVQDFMYPENRTQESAIMIRHPSLRIKVKPSAY